MQTNRRVLRATLALLLAVTAGAPALAAERASIGPVLLSDRQMDEVTAGSVSLNLNAGALAVGSSFSLTEVNGGGASGSTPIPGGGSIQSGAIVGTAVGYAPGGAASAGASTSGSVSGPTTVYISASGGASYPGGQTSISATFISGGPTFLP